MESSATMLWGLIFGSIGMGFFVYGKKQGRYSALIAGVALMVFPYFVTNWILILCIGAALMAVPFFWRD